MDSDVSENDTRESRDSRTGYILVVILVMIIVLTIAILVIMLTVYLTNKLNGKRFTARASPGSRPRSSDKVVIPQHSIDGIAGTSYSQYKHVGNGMGIVQCGLDGRSELRDGKCVCAGSYWGINCELESYNPEFTAIGTAMGTGIPGITGFNNTFRECHDTCLIDGDCTGFQWVDCQCSILSSTPIITVDQAPIYNPLVQSQLFLKTGRPLFSDVVFLYYGNLPRRFWQGNRDNVIPVVPGSVYQLPFIPDNWINDSQLDLALSDEPFSNPSQAKRIQRGNQQFLPTTYNWVMIILDNRSQGWSSSIDC